MRKIEQIQRGEKEKRGRGRGRIREIASCLPTKTAEANNPVVAEKGEKGKR